MSFQPRTTMDLADLTPRFLQEQYLIGLSMTGADNRPLADSIYEFHINSAIAKIEELVNIDIVPKKYESEKHDYYISDYMQYAFIPLYHFPIREVTEVRAVYPTGQSIQVFPSEWIRVETLRGQINIIPTAGTLGQVLIGQGGSFLPLFYSGCSYLPALWQVDYESGFNPNKLPYLVVDAICKMACIDLLMKMSDLITPLGVNSTSLSVDGLSQSRSYQQPAFKARIDQYKEDLFGSPASAANHDGLLGQMRSNYLGIVMASM